MNYPVIEDLWWEHDEPEYYHSKGHCDKDQFLEVLGGCLQMDPNELSSTGSVTHCWARNLQTASSRELGLNSEVRLYSEKSRGTYPVTVWRPKPSGEHPPAFESAAWKPEASAAKEGE